MSSKSSIYCSFTLNELKVELKKRNAKQSGRKKELIERLEAYDRNSNFGKSDCDSSTQADYSLTLPNAMDYLDLNSDKKFAHVNMEHIVTYLRNFDKNFDQTPVNLYKEKYLCYMRVYESDNRFFVKSACRAEMKKAVTYIVDVIFSADGDILESQCECAAGMGPNAHCKHVCTLLYAAHMFQKSGSVVVDNTCTEKLQSFHRVKKKYTGSPTKANNLDMPGADESTNLYYDPRPESFRNTAAYQSFFRNVCLNYKGISTMPIFQLFEPANIRASSHDHDYLVRTPEEIFLDSFSVSTITDDQISSIKLRTRGQSGNDSWFEERKKRIQSSNFGRICRETDRTDRQKLAVDLINTKSFTSRATEHGKKYEKNAVKKYENLNSVNVAESGIFVSPSMPFLGASPDGIVSDSLIVEVKCPFVAKDKQITPLTVPYLKAVGSGLELPSSHNYYYQVQGQLFCTGRSACDFVVFTNEDIKCLRIERDNNFISSMLEKLRDFYTHYFEPALLNEFYYKTL